MDTFCMKATAISKGAVSEQTYQLQSFLPLLLFSSLARLHEAAA
jgi:hypothetical protein